MRLVLLTLVASTLVAAPQCTTCERDANGRIHRSSAARREFRRLNPCPSSGETRGACPGYVIDHVIPLACSGSDDPSNMQWQTVSDAKEKDKRERRQCGGQYAADLGVPASRARPWS